MTVARRQRKMVRHSAPRARRKHRRHGRRAAAPAPVAAGARPRPGGARLPSAQTHLLQRALLPAAHARRRGRCPDTEEEVCAGGTERKFERPPVHRAERGAVAATEHLSARESERVPSPWPSD